MTLSSVINHHVNDRISRRLELAMSDLPHTADAHWPVAPGTEPLDVFPPGEILASSIDRRDREVLLQDAFLNLNGGHLYVTTFANSPQRAADRLAEILRLIPRGENPDPDTIPVTFWSLSTHGPASITRDLDADSWETIRENYTAETQAELDRMMSEGFRPGLGGQLLLWHGEPGTGKTTALRALAREWKDWAEVHYIVDPDNFFGSAAYYMVNVLMGGEQYASLPGGNAEEEDEAKPPWRILILEDCGEMLQPDARRDVGQALSRFLNACDGLIGRGLRVLVLVTTNEKLSKLHEAVARPGRCAAEIEFGTFAPLEADRWLEAHSVDPGSSNAHVTLADLYAEVEGARRRESEPKVGFGA